MQIQQGKKTILVVDDDIILSKTQSILLKRNGYEVVIANSGTQAVKLCRENQNIDLILMDIDLGFGIDGTEAAAIIMKERDVPVLFLSSHTEPEIVEKTEKITSYGYVVKNSAETVLMASIKMAFKLHDAHCRLKEREAALKESESRFVEFMKYLPGLAYIKDPQRKILFVSEQFVDSFGIPIENWIGKTDEELWPGEVGERIKRNDEQVLSTQQVFTTEEVIPVKGELHTYFTIKFPIPRPGLSPLLGGISLDITGQKKIESALNLSQEIFRLFMEHSPIYVFFKDEEIRPIQLSKNYEQLLGRPISEILGKTMDDLFPSELAKSMIEDDKKILREGRLIEVVEEMDGKTYTTIKFPIKREGHPTWLAGFTIDITKQKTAERLLSQALEEKKSLLRELQHRIKNSLNLITGILGLENSQIQDEAVKNILKGINSRILSLADLYSSLYKTDSLHEVKLAQYFGRVIQSIEDSFLYKNHMIEIFTELEDMILEFNSAATLGLVLNELLTNALKYAFPENRKGQISVTLKKIDSDAVMEIVNNGIPLPENFDISHSSGIGLTLVQMMAEQLKGELTYHTLKEKNDQKTIFKIKFPYEEIRKLEKSQSN